MLYWNWSIGYYHDFFFNWMDWWTLNVIDRPKLIYIEEDQTLKLQSNQLNFTHNFAFRLRFDSLPFYWMIATKWIKPLWCCLLKTEPFENQQIWQDSNLQQCHLQTLLYHWAKGPCGTWGINCNSVELKVNSCLLTG